MEFCLQLYESLNDEQKEKIDYKPTNQGPVLQTRLANRIAMMGENDGHDFVMMTELEFTVGPPESQAKFYALRHVFSDLSSWFIENLNGPEAPSTFDFPDLEAEGFRAIFRMAHGLDPNINVNNVMPVLNTATFFNYRTLTDACLGLLTGAVTVDNVMGVLDAAVSQDIITPNFELECCKIILSQPKMVVDSPAFLTVQEELMGRILDCDYLAVDEIYLWRRVMLWAKNRSLLTRQKEFESIPAEERDESKFDVNDVVMLPNGTQGEIKFKGETHLGPGVWYGIDLEEGVAGDTDGLVDGQRYFRTSREKNGMLVQSFRIDSMVIDNEEEVEDQDINEITCDCGQTISKIPARECYGGDWVNCTSCQKSLGRGDTLVFHCPKGRIPLHAGGYDICEQCAGSKRVVARNIENQEKIVPTKQDAKYLRPILTNIRFPVMPMNYFIDNTYPILPKPLADSIVMNKIKPTVNIPFKKNSRTTWSDSALNWTAVAAKPDLERAKKVFTEGTEAHWSGEKMNQHNNEQWFIIQFAHPAQISRLDHKNYYADGDTIKNVEVKVLPEGIEWTEEENEGDNWVDAFEYESKKTNDWQNSISAASPMYSRWYKYIVRTVWGGEDNYPCLDELRLWGDERGAVQDIVLEERTKEADFTVVYADPQPEKAATIPDTGEASQWSGDRMDSLNREQFFVFDLGQDAMIGKLEFKHRYSDNDTIKEVKLYRLPTGVAFGDDHKTPFENTENTGDWVFQCDILSDQSTDIQTKDVTGEAVPARFWKFSVLSVYGGGLDAGNYPCLNWMKVFTKQRPWTTGYCEVNFDAPAPEPAPQEEKEEQKGDESGGDDDDDEKVDVESNANENEDGNDMMMLNSEDDNEDDEPPNPSPPSSSDDDDD